MARNQTITPYIPGRTETGKIAAGTWTINEVGKPVTIDGEDVDLAADGEEIYGFIQSVESYSKGGKKIMTVGCDVGMEFWAEDEDDNLVVNDLVFAGTPVAIGTALGNGVLPNVVKGVSAPTIDRWRVVSKVGTTVLVRKI